MEPQTELEDYSMQLSSTNRVIVNVLAQYGKTITNVLLGLYSTRIVLAALGSSDFGIYSLVGGVIAMLGFMTNALIITTQRFMSYHQGKSDIDKLRTIFSNSVSMHILLGSCVVAILFIASFFLFDGYLVIDHDRLFAAKCIFSTVTASLFITFVTSPFKALLVSHENIVYVSVIDVLDGILKVIVAFAISFCGFDKLIFYGMLMSCISLFNFIAFFTYSRLRYEESQHIVLFRFDKEYIRSLFSFALWTSYSSFCLFIKNQGIAVILNRIYGTAINAAYGIAFNVSSAVQFVCLSVCNAINPQLMKAEGSNNRAKMLRLAETESKFAFILMFTICIPCITEMPLLLRFWLGNVPEYAVFFCRTVVIAATIDQLTIGIGAAMQAVGRIRKYNTIIYSIKILALPLAIICNILGFGVIYIMYGFVATELLSSLLRLVFLMQLTEESIWGFVRRVILKSTPPLLGSFCMAYLSVRYIHSCRFIFTFALSIMASFSITYIASLEENEKNIINRFVQKIIKR